MFRSYFFFSSLLFQLMWDTCPLPTWANSDDWWVQFTPEKHLGGLGWLPPSVLVGRWLHWGESPTLKCCPSSVWKGPPPSSDNQEEFRRTIHPAEHRLVGMYISFSLSFTSVAVPEDLMERLVSLRTSCEHQSQRSRVSAGKEGSPN